MRQLLAGLIIGALLLPDAALATYSGYGTPTPFDSTGGIAVTSEIIKSGKIAPPKPAKPKTTKKKKQTSKKSKKKAPAKKKKSTKKKTAAKKPAPKKKSTAAKPRTPHVFKEETLQDLPPVDAPMPEQAAPAPPDTLPPIDLPTELPAAPIQ